MKKENILILGGTSHTMKILASYNFYNIEDITYYNKNEIYGKYDWTYLDMGDFSTIDLFLTKINDKKYSKIIFAIGNSFVGDENNIEELVLFYKAYLINYIYLINNLIKNLKSNGQIIFISSIASEIPIQNAHYSAVKAGVEAFIRSKSISMKENQILYSISPSTISQEIAKQICQVIMFSNYTVSGKTIKVGW